MCCFRLFWDHHPGGLVMPIVMTGSFCVCPPKKFMPEFLGRVCSPMRELKHLLAGG